jgi:D-beta-D-heptose 7-phosphate kinase/D-beta-D-heptose 1-phosphate adenosyltransferase
LVKPDVLAKGADYTVEQVVGREHVNEVRLIDFVEGYSTSIIIEKSKRD